MIGDPGVLEGLLTGPLAGRRVHSFGLPGLSESVLAVAVDPAGLLEEWGAARALVDVTGRWPVAACTWGEKGAPTAEAFFFREDRNRQARALLGHLEGSPIDRAAVDAIVRSHFDVGHDDDDVRIDLDATRERCGHAPSVAELEAGIRSSVGREGRDFAIERFLFDWEERQRATAVPLRSERDDWFEPETDECWLLFLPDQDGSSALAYYAFYGEDHSGATTERLVQTLRWWNAEYGAELVAHWGTMLQFVVARPPETLGQAFELARKHHAVAPCTTVLTGEPIRDLARRLWRGPRWFLHERP